MFGGVKYIYYFCQILCVFEEQIVINYQLF